MGVVSNILFEKPSRRDVLSVGGVGIIATRISHSPGSVFFAQGALAQRLRYDERRRGVVAGCYVGQGTGWIASGL